MADYKQQNVAGTSWQRAWQVVVSNPLGGLPTVHYDEERIINLGDTQLRDFAVGGIAYTVDPSAVIKLRDTDTLELTGETIPVALVHQALLSDYLDRALERDNK